MKKLYKATAQELLAAGAARAALATWQKYELDNEVREAAHLDQREALLDALRAGGSPNVPSEEYGDLALELVLEPEEAAILLAFGADPLLPNIRNITPLEEHIRVGHTMIVGLVADDILARDDAEARLAPFRPALTQAAGDAQRKKFRVTAGLAARKFGLQL